MPHITYKPVLCRYFYVRIHPYLSVTPMCVYTPQCVYTPIPLGLVLGLEGFGCTGEVSDPESESDFSARPIYIYIYIYMCVGVCVCVRVYVRIYIRT